MKTTENRFDLDGMIAMVTGASSGLGAYFAQVLAEAGASVVVTARRVEKLQAVAEGINASGGEAFPMECDVTVSSQVADVIRDAWNDHGRIDIIVNNAGIAIEAGAPEKEQDGIFEQVVQTNLVGLWYCCKEVGARMLADGKGGSIINIASILGLGGGCDHPPAYQSTKAAVINLTRNLACSWADRGVRVNAIAPGYFPSEMTDPFFHVDGFMEYVNASSPAGRIGRVDELAGPLLLLASSAGSYMNGHTLVVDGGYSASIGHNRFGEEVYRGLQKLVGDQAVPITP